jgi:hypothetical protein
MKPRGIPKIATFFSRNVGYVDMSEEQLGFPELQVQVNRWFREHPNIEIISVNTNTDRDGDNSNLTYTITYVPNADS